VAVIHPTVTDAELKMLTNGGIRGIRFSITDPRNSSTSFEMIEPLSKRVSTLGWHVLINMSEDQINGLSFYEPAKDAGLPRPSLLHYVRAFNRSHPGAACEYSGRAINRTLESQRSSRDRRLQGNGGRPMGRDRGARCVRCSQITLRVLSRGAIVQNHHVRKHPITALRQRNREQRSRFRRIAWIAG
jgi:hypothetical protein